MLLFKQSKQWKQCIKQCIARCYLHLWWYFSYLSLCWSCQVFSSNWVYPGNLTSRDTNQPFLSSPLLSGLPKYQHTHDAEKREIPVEFLSTYLRVHFVKAKILMFSKKIEKLCLPWNHFRKKFPVIRQWVWGSSWSQLRGAGAVTIFLLLIPASPSSSSSSPQGPGCLSGVNQDRIVAP